MARKLVVLLIIAGSIAAVACNTVRGAGEDLGSAANAVDEANE